MMRQLALVISFLMASVVTVKVHAHAELNGFYSSEALATGASDASTRMFVEASVGFAIDKKAEYLVGWNYSIMNTTDKTGETTTNYSSTQMGPRFLWFMTKSRSWSVGLGYYLVTQATFDNGSGSSAKWKGTALKFDVGYNFPIGDDFLAGIRLNYSSASYTERLVGDTDYSTVGYTKTSMYPSLYTTWIF